MADSTARLLHLLGLLQSRPAWTGAELAAQLKVTPRSVRRDISRLRELGYPVAAERGAAGGYQLTPGRAIPPLVLDPDEAVAIALALRLAATGSVAGQGEVALRTLTKLYQVLPARLRGRVSSLTEATMTLPDERDQVDPDLLITLSAAVRSRARVNLDYTDRTGTATTRRVEPYRLAATRSRWYLVAFDLDRADWRTLRLDRMRTVRATTFGFTARATPDLEDYLRRALSGAPYRRRARIEVAVSAEVARGYLGEAAEVTVVDDHSCRVTVGADSYAGLARYLMLWDTDFRVLDSPGLQQALLEYADRAARCATS